MQPASKKIIICIEATDLIMLVSLFLEKHDFQVVAGQRDLLMEIVAAERPHAIILDEDISGLPAIVDELKTKPETSLISLLVLYSQQHNIHSLQNVDSYLQKPFAADDLMKKLQKLLHMKEKLLPGDTIGILGSGQLGRMLALEARRMGFQTHVFSPAKKTPTGQVADLEICAGYDDLDAVRKFARNVDVVTYEFENVPSATAEACQEFSLLRPGVQALHVSQNRLREKTFFAENGLPTVPFVAVASLAELESGLAEIGYPAVLKTAVSGYDGKGQFILRQPENVAQTWQAAADHSCILESWVEFERELSVVAARGLDGEFAHYGVIENDHHRHILDVSKAPAAVATAVADRAVAMARTVLEALDVVGVLCVEFFLTAAGELLVNEIAPRPHNSGHLTIEACVTSQFEQQLRAVCGLPLGSTDYLCPAAMANLLGDLWFDQGKGAGAWRGEPDWSKVLAEPGLKLHLYGKHDARPGRKMGHLTAVADTIDQAEKIVREAREVLRD